MLRSTESDKTSRRTLLGAKIIFNERSSVADCTLGVPNAFKLIIKPHDDTYLCDVTARTATELKVSFKCRVNAVSLKKKKLTLQW
jgi:hypothetical protein